MKRSYKKIQKKKRWKDFQTMKVIFKELLNEILKELTGNFWKDFWKKKLFNKFSKEAHEEIIGGNPEEIPGRILEKLSEKLLR